MLPHHHGRHGFSSQHNFTYGKAIDDSSSSGGDKNVLTNVGGQVDGLVAFGASRSLDRSVSSFDQRFLFNNTLIYAAGWSSPVLGVLVWKAGPLCFPFGVVGPLALLGAAMLAALLLRPRFEVARILPRMITAGQAFDYRVLVKNLGTRPADGLALLEDLSDPRPSFAEFRSALRFLNAGS